MTDLAREELDELLDEVRLIELQSRRLVTDVMAGSYHSVFRGAGIEFDEVREYQDGDDPRSVDWNVTARVGRPFVKKYRDERELTVFFALDLSRSMEAGFGPWSARRMAARIAACLALSAVRNGDKVGMIAFSDGVERYVRAEKGMGHALRIVRDVLALPASPRPTRYEETLAFLARVVRRKAIVFLLSDFLGADPSRALASCARRHDVIAVRLLAPELRPADGGLERVRDPETGRECLLDWSDESVRRTYEEAVSAWDARVRETLRRAKVDLLDVPVPAVRTRNAIAGPILSFFRMRELRGAKR